MMMDNLGPIILAVCGLSVVCIGLLAVVAFIVFRFTGGALFGPLTSIISGLGREEDEADSDYVPRRPVRRPSRTPSAQSAQSARPGLDDFDAAVERYRQQGKSGSGSGSSLSGAPSLRRGSSLSSDLTPSGNPSASDDSASGSLRRRSRRRDEDAEIYDDDDEDGGLFGF